MPTPAPTPADLGTVLGRFFDEAHQVEPSRLVALIAASAAELGSATTRVWLADHEQRVLVPASDAGRLDPLPIEGTSAGRAFVTSQAVVSEPGAGPTHAWLPMLDGVDRIGVLEVEGPDLDEDRLEALRHLTSAATAEVVTRGQYTDEFTTRRRREQMSVSAELQWQALPPASFTTTDVAVAGVLEPAYDVGGDAFDYSHAPGRLDLAVIDAVGHDLTASLISMLAIGAYRNARRTTRSVIDAAELMDRTIRSHGGRGAFATGILATLDTETGVFSWLNAGHPQPLLVRDEHVHTLESTPRPPLGLGHLGPPRADELVAHQLQPGDGILLYTDGIVEARRPGGEDFGEARLQDFLHTAFAAGQAPHETLRRLSHAVLDFHEGVLRDDATTLLTVWQPA